MNLYPDKIEKVLGIDQIRHLLAAQCSGNPGKEWVKRLTPSTNRKQIQKWLDQVEEYVQVLKSDKQPSLHTEYLTDQIEKLKIKNNVLSDEELLIIRTALRLATAIVGFFERSETTYHELSELVQIELPPVHIVKMMDDVYDEEGRWKRNASKKLADILGELDRLERKVYLNLSKTYEKGLSSGWMADTGLTVKEGRLVLPVIAEHKRKIQGVVHDESGGGTILYIEPIAVLENSNQLRELEMERDREMHRIRAKITAELSPYAGELQILEHRMGILDFIRAKARLAIELDAVKPGLSVRGEVKFENMRHPLLDVHHRKSGKEVVPMDVVLNDENRILVVSGPNAGGKSVAIKTLALNQYLLQSGMLIPCGEESESRVFKKLFVDIGDSQSIENDLSSYSGHLTAMKHFVSRADSHTLLVIDEIGSGTDPNFGGAMAEAIMLSLHAKKPLGMITTHFGSIKKLADKTEGMLNASMAFDTDRLVPLYRLQTGIPGSSFALEVARNIGLPENIIKQARKRSNTIEQRTDELLAKLETERQTVRELSDKLKSDNDHLERLKKDYQAMKDELADKRKGVMDGAREKALEVLKEANAEVERTIKAIKEAGGDRKKTQAARKKLQKIAVDHKKSLGLMDGASNVKSIKKEEVEPLKVGDQVFIPNSSSVGEVVEIRKNKAVVVAGIIKSTYPLDQLKPSKRKKEKVKSRSNTDVLKTRSEFVMEKDIRGLRGPEALKEIDKWIDQAIVVGSPQLRLIHGKGDGILKRLIRDYYQNSPYIKKISSESFELGGDGVSIIELA